jgi:hypothetical protein
MAPEHEVCLKQEDWGRLWEIVKTHSLHVLEGNKEGGFRDRLLLAETDIKALKQRFWQSSLIGALIGTLIGSSCKEAIQLFVGWFIKR